MKRSMQALPRQQGFTLIEIAIVLVIIGLLVGGVLQGQQLIENSRVKQAVKDMQGTAAANFAYQDRYGALPGDDGDGAAFTARGGSWTAGIANARPNGVIAARGRDTFTGGGEGGLFWRQLKAAGFISGDPADAAIAALPTNAWGGLMGVTAEAVPGGLTGTKVCISQVPGASAAAIDNQLDDGNSNSGSLRATQGVSGANTAPNAAAASYSEDFEYTLCYRM